MEELSAMKNTKVISGASAHQVALSSDQKLAGSKRVNRRPIPPAVSTTARRKPSVTDLELKNSEFEPIPEQTKVAMGADLESRIRLLEQVTGHLRAELATLTKASKDIG